MSYWSSPTDESRRNSPAIRRRLSAPPTLRADMGTPLPPERNGSQFLWYFLTNLSSHASVSSGLTGRDSNCQHLLNQVLLWWRGRKVLWSGAAARVEER